MKWDRTKLRARYSQIVLPGMVYCFDCRFKAWFCHAQALPGLLAGRQSHDRPSSCLRHVTICTSADNGCLASRAYIILLVAPHMCIAVLLQYTSRAAQLYRQQLEKEAAKLARYEPPHQQSWCSQVAGTAAILNSRRSRRYCCRGLEASFATYHSHASLRAGLQAGRER